MENLRKEFRKQTGTKLPMTRTHEAYSHYYEKYSEWLEQQLKNCNLQNVSNCVFDDETLLQAFKALFGSEWKKTWTDNSKIREMKSIIDGGTMPCVELQNWINCIAILQKH